MVKTEGMMLLKILLPRKVTPLDSNTTEVSLSLYLEYTFLGRLLKRSILKRITKNVKTN
jgi:hypothetical protein